MLRNRIVSHGVEDRSDIIQISFSPRSQNDIASCFFNIFGISGTNNLSTSSLSSAVTIFCSSSHVSQARRKGGVLIN